MDNSVNMWKQSMAILCRWGAIYIYTCTYVYRYIAKGYAWNERCNGVVQLIKTHGKVAA